MDIVLISVIAVIVVAFIFDFTNGFHDAANSVATVVATRALPAKWAPTFSAVFNFLAYFVVGTAVANTIAKTVKSDYAGVSVVFAALFAAIAWNYLTWRFGLPSSSSHAIIGGLVGAGIAAGGLAAISWESVQKAAIGIIASPAVAFSIAFLAMFLVRGLQRAFKLRDNAPVFKGLQLITAAAVSFGHGANDAQKTMGVIAALLLGAGYTTMAADGSTVVVPEWVALSAYGAIAIGTLWGGLEDHRDHGLENHALARQLWCRRQHWCRDSDVWRHRNGYANFDHPCGRDFDRGRGCGIGYGCPLAGSWPDGDRLGGYDPSSSHSGLHNVEIDLASHLLCLLVGRPGGSGFCRLGNLGHDSHHSRQGR